MGLRHCRPYRREALYGLQATDTPVRDIYEGSILVVFAVCIGGATAVGAGIGWLIPNARMNPGVPPNDVLR
jgi:hypothetical protein